ncbi:MULTISPECIES: hypothetical protein [Cytobacillus]|uniref:hypothetical protein n=1 Tax=Cytobacillus sp. Bac17 TaxID=2926008 RepID=UPI0021192A78|nr:hypothetical protein [Cytobacillus sp. Bac17]MCM3395448.1 hypothetical protein [Cytobacillus oceanisediminis]
MAILKYDVLRNTSVFNEKRHSPAGACPGSQKKFLLALWCLYYHFQVSIANLKAG